MRAVTNSDIRRALDEKILALLSDLGLTENDIAWSNYPFRPDPEKNSLRTTLMPGIGGAMTLGPNCFVRHVGIYQVSIYTPKGIGIGAAEQLADGIINAFPLGMTLQCCNQWLVLTNVYTGSAMEEEMHLHLPVSIAYELYAPQKQN